MIVTRGLGRASTQQTYMVSMGLGKYLIVVDELGNIRIVRIITSVDDMDVRVEVLEAF